MIFVGLGIGDHAFPEAIGLFLGFFANLVDIAVDEFAITDDDFAIDDGMANAFIIDDAKIGDGGFGGTTAVVDIVERAEFGIEEIAHHAPAAVETVIDIDRIVAIFNGEFAACIAFDDHVAGPAIDAEGDFLGIVEIVRPSNLVAVVRTRVLDVPETEVGTVFRLFGRHVDAVDVDRVGNDAAEFFEAVDGGFETAGDGIFDIGSQEREYYAAPSSFDSEEAALTPLVSGIVTKLYRTYGRNLMDAAFSTFRIKSGR